MAVPRLAGAMVTLHVANPALHETTCHEQIPSHRRVAVTLANWLGLFRDIKGVGGRALHPEGQLHGVDPGIESFIAGPVRGVTFIQRLGESKQISLGPRVNIIAVEMRDHFAAFAVRFDVRSLVNAGKERTRPIAGLSRRHSTRHENDIPGKILALCSETVEHPRADAGSGKHRVTAIHHEKSRRVIRDLTLHRTNHTELVRMLRDIRIQRGNFESALPVFREFKRRGPDLTDPVALRRLEGLFDGLRQLLSVEFFQPGLWIEGVNLRRPAIHEKMDDAFCLCGKMRLAHGEWRIR